MALTREQNNAMARQVVKTVQPKDQPHGKHEELLAAFRRLDEPLPPTSRPINPAAKDLTLSTPTWRQFCFRPRPKANMR